MSDALNAADGVELRRVRRVNHPPKPPNDIVWMPRYAQYLANPLVTGVARRVLDDHLRIGQLHIRMVETDKPDGSPGGFGPVSRRGRSDARGWHTDWPHDLSRLREQRCRQERRLHPPAVPRHPHVLGDDLVSHGCRCEFGWHMGGSRLSQGKAESARPLRRYHDLGAYSRRYAGHRPRRLGIYSRLAELARITPAQFQRARSSGCS